MEDTLKTIVSLLLGYLMGAIPTAYIFGKLSKGIDIREHGSGNVGATNVFRTLGKYPGIIVLALDIAKGFLAVVLLSAIFRLDSNVTMILTGCAAVCGHNWTIFLNFKGGKGIATSLGVFLGLSVKVATLGWTILIVLLVWMACFFLSGFVSLASLVAATMLPLTMLATSQDFELVVLGVVFCIFIVIRHQPNIKRLLSGQEPRVNIKIPWK